MTTRSTFGSRRSTLAVAAGFALTLGACASGSTAGGTLGGTSTGGTMQTASGGEVVGASMDKASVRRMVASWPEKQRGTAEELIAKYGDPAVVGDRMLVWYDTGPFVRTELSRDAVPHNFPMAHVDYLAQTVRHAPNLDKLDDLAEFDGSVWFQRTRGELSAQCDLEPMNMLALNLAHDVSTGKRTVVDARAFYAKTAMAFKQGDKSSPYVSGIMFPTGASAAFADQPHQK